MNLRQFFNELGSSSSESSIFNDNDIGDVAVADEIIWGWFKKLLELLLDVSASTRGSYAGLNYDLHSGRPKSAIAPEFIAKVHKMVMEVCRPKVWETAQAVGMSSE